MLYTIINKKKGGSIMEHDRALWILDHLWDLACDELGRDYVLKELAINYNTHLDDYEYKYLCRSLFPNLGGEY